MADTDTEYKDYKNNNSKEQPETTNDGKDLPDFKEIVGYIYSSYMGDELISGVESLQEKYPSLKPFIYSSSVMSIVPLAIFAQSVLFIFSANVFVGTFAIYGYRKACNIPQVENMGNYCYNKLYSIMASKEDENTKENSKENSDEIKSLKRIFTKVYDIMGDVNSSLKLAFAKSSNETSEEVSQKGFSIATIYGFFEPLMLMFKGKSSENSDENKNDYNKPEYASGKPSENENDDKKSECASSGTPSKSPVPEGLPPNESPPESYKKGDKHQTGSSSYQKSNNNEEPYNEDKGKETYADVVKENPDDNKEKETYADAVKENPVDNKEKETYADAVKENTEDNKEKESYADVVKEGCDHNEDKENCTHESCGGTKKKGLVTGTTNSIDNKKDEAVEAAGLPKDDTKTSGIVEEPEATKDVDPVL